MLDLAHGIPSIGVAHLVLLCVHYTFSMQSRRPLAAKVDHSPLLCSSCQPHILSRKILNNMASTFAAYSTPKPIMHLYAEGTVVGHPQDYTTMPEVTQNSHLSTV